ncbi:MAG: hypothetical protein U9R28_10020 [Pseudomonadota bacterium]|nr:hypothetical protein [Pseudomonadota bacterium]
MKHQLIALLIAGLMGASMSVQASVWQDIKEGASESWQATKEAASELAEGTKEAVNDEDNQETAKEIWSNVKEDASKAWDVTKEGASVAADVVVETSKEGYAKAKELAEE